MVGVGRKLGKDCEEGLMVYLFHTRKEGVAENRSSGRVGANGKDHPPECGKRAKLLHLQSRGLWYL